MDHRAFFDELKKGNIASCYVFEGPEEYIKRSAMDALRKKLLPEGMEEMNESRLRDPDANTIIAAAETLPCWPHKSLPFLTRRLPKSLPPSVRPTPPRSLKRTRPSCPSCNPKIFIYLKGE